MKRLSEIAGCRSPWDVWSSSSIPLCDTLEKANYYMDTYARLAWSELKIITNFTGCLTPCVYKEYKVIGEPLTYTKPICFEG